MKILAIDTATEACSVALLYHGQVIEDFVVAPQQHSKLILPMIDKLLAQAGLTLTDLTALAFGKGPGSFTGVRIAASVIQGLAFATDLPVAAVSTLQAMAQGAFREYQASAVLAAIDARMQEIYYGQYILAEDNFMHANADELVCQPASIEIDPEHAWIGVGTGWQAYADILQAKVVKSYAYFPHAHDIAHLAHMFYQKNLCVAAEYAVPVYLRDNIATPKNERVK